MKKLIQLFSLTVAALLASCQGTEEPAGPQVVASIVTFDGTSDSGISTFSYVDANNDSIRLQAAWTSPDSKLQVGNRALIYYLADDYGVSTQIQLTAVMPIPTGKPEIAAAADIHPGEPLRQVRIWRSGQWLNLAATVSFSGDAKNIDLLVEASTLNNPGVNAFIVVEADATSRPAAERQLYASWLINEILDRTACDSISVTYTAPNYELKSIKITK